MISRNKSTLAPLLEAFFTKRLMNQRCASPHTIAAYRDTFRLLLRFAQERTGRKPSTLSIDELDAPLITSFLDHLEKKRGNTSRSRNARLAAVHSFFKFVALEEPAHAGVAQRILSVPTKKTRRRIVQFLTTEEISAILDGIDIKSWAGRRDYALILLAVQTGLRVSELIGLRVKDVRLGRGSHVQCCGKGRKDRCTPLRRDVVRVLRRWLRERRGVPEDPVFPNARGKALSRDGVSYILSRHALKARRRCSSLRRKRVTPHVLRHSAAMDILSNKVDRSVIALWLGHESSQTTDIYLHADLAIKERALSKSTEQSTRAGRYRPDDEVLAFLDEL